MKVLYKDILSKISLANRQQAQSDISGMATKKQKLDPADVVENIRKELDE